MPMLSYPSSFAMIGLLLKASHRRSRLKGRKGEDLSIIDKLIGLAIRLPFTTERRAQKPCRQLYPLTA